MPGASLAGRNFVADLERFGGFAVAVARLHGQLVGFGQQRLVLELVVQPVKGVVHRAVVEPVAHAQREEILAAVHGLGVETEVFEGAAREALKFNGEKAKLVERVVFQRIHGHLRLAQVVFGEAVVVDDEDAVGLQVADVHLQRRGIHGHQHVHGIAGV